MPLYAAYGKQGLKTEASAWDASAHLPKKKKPNKQQFIRSSSVIFIHNQLSTPYIKQFSCPNPSYK